jgi:cell volume regulation protein A
MDFLLNLCRHIVSDEIVYLALPLALFFIVTLAVQLDKRSIPVIFVGLIAGVIFGKDGLKFWIFDNLTLAKELANLALVFILFHGGFCTKKELLKIAALPGIGMATWGVILSAVVTFACLHFILGWNKNIAMLISIVISSTDAPAIFSILRKQTLGHKLKSIVETESASSDPMVIILTIIGIQILSSSGDTSYLTYAGLFFWKFAGGFIFGFLAAKGAARLINKLTPQENAYYYIIMLCTAIFTFGLAELFSASGLLAVFTAGVVLGNTQFVHKQGVYNFSYAISTIANILLLVLLGVLATPSSWFEGSEYFNGPLYINGILLFFFLAFVARPASVFLGTLGMGINIREKIFISWAGLRGSVPISLATFPAAAGIAGGSEIFNIAFFAVLLSIMIQGLSLGKLTKLLKLSTVSRPDPPYSLEFIAKDDMEAGQRLTIFTIDLPDPEGAKGPLIRDLRLPENALLLMITRRQHVSAMFRKTQKILSILNERNVRNSEEARELASKAHDMILKMNEKKSLAKDETEAIWMVLPPKGDTALCGWDQITILSKVEDKDEVREILLESFQKCFT